MAIRSTSNIISALQNLKMADLHLESFQNDNKGSAGARLFKLYREKINWVLRDLITHPFLPEAVRHGIKHEINSDVLSVPALFEKIPLLQPDQREMLEIIVDKLLSGEKLEYVHEEENY